MSSADDEFFRKLLATFRVEADEHVQGITAGLIDLEKNPSGAEQAAIIERIFREAHSLKGAARAVNLGDVESICQVMESAFAKWKAQEAQPSPGNFDTLHRALDTIAVLLASGAPAADASMKKRVTDAVAAISRLDEPDQPQDAAPAATPAPPPPAVVEEQTHEANSDEVSSRSPAMAAAAASPSPAHGPLADTVRIATAKLDALLLQAEETVALKLTSTQRAADLREVKTLLQDWSKQWARIQPQFRALRQGTARHGAGEGQLSAPVAAKMTEFFEWSHSQFKVLDGRVSALMRAVEMDRRSQGGMVDNLLDETKRLLMMPFSLLLGMFPRVVRDLARELGKEAELVISGGEVEIDKRILEELRDPLIHLLRNCLDHGIEKPAVRVNHNKPARATLTVAVTQISGGEVEVRVSDDGAGIDLAAVKSSAVKNNLISAEDARNLDDLGALPLIFQSGFSTSAMLTEISGRGLGLAIVREKVDKLNGHIFVETQRLQGTTFRILLPLTLATFKGVQVQCANQSFVLPTANIECVVRVLPSEVQTVENRETILINGRAVALVWLADVLEIGRDHNATPAGSFPAIVLSAGDKRIAFRADAVLNEQEVLVKPLGRPLVRVRNVAGVTVLGSGAAVPILNAADLIKSAMKTGATPRMLQASTAAASRKKPSLLLAEDSVTSRMLLKNILENAGYRVRAVVDGLEAWTALRDETFDALVTDVDMPRMDGIALTEKVRGDARTESLPVVLVTSRDAREDRERGVDAGASAYIIKSSFDQSNLLEALERLI